MPDPHTTHLRARGEPLVDFVAIGAMKCGTTSLHHHLSCHPALALPPEKEVNFFFGDAPGGTGNLWRGSDWYRSRFPHGARLRGDVSPGYTSPDHPGVAARLSEAAPQAKLLYLVRDPLDRAVSQHRHHQRDGAEPRSLRDALTDPASHYVLRSRYADRLAPFLDRFPPEQIAVVELHDLQARTSETLASVCRFLEVAPLPDDHAYGRRLNAAGSAPPPVPADVASAFRSLVADDVASFAVLRRQLRRCAPGT